MVKKGSSQDEKNFAIFFHFENNEISKEDYDHGSFEAFLSYEAKHRNSDCGTGSRSDNTIGSPHGFIIHWIVTSKNIKEVTEVIDVENWRIVQFSGVEVGCFFDRMELFCFVDEVFDSEYVQVQEQCEHQARDTGFGRGMQAIKGIQGFYSVTSQQELRRELGSQKASSSITTRRELSESVQENIINEVKRQLAKLLPKAVSDFATLVIQSMVKNALEKTPLLVAQSSSQAPPSLKAASLLFDALLNSILLDDDVARGQADPENVLRKRDHDDEDPSAGPNQGKKTKRSRTKESEPSKKSSTPKNHLKFKPPPRPPTPDQEWNKRQVVVDQPEQPWFNNMCRPGRLTVAAEYFFNNDLEFLKSSDPEKKCTMSITKTKAARYEIVGIEDMVPTLWSPTKVGYNKDAEKGIKHWGDKRQLCMVTVNVKKLHGYVYLEEIMVRRVDRQLYKFKEGDFVDLHLNDIEDMLLLAVQHKCLKDWIIETGYGWASELEMDYRLMTRTECRQPIEKNVMKRKKESKKFKNSTQANNMKLCRIKFRGQWMKTFIVCKNLSLSCRIQGEVKLQKRTELKNCKKLLPFRMEDSVLEILEEQTGNRDHQFG
ncbi:hypothetical protein Tco_1106452 [Tanacetum coccineum]